MAGLLHMFRLIGTSRRVIQSNSKFGLIADLAGVPFYRNPAPIKVASRLLVSAPRPMRSGEMQCNPLTTNRVVHRVVIEIAVPVGGACT